MTQTTEAPSGVETYLSLFERLDPEWSRNGREWLAPIRRGAIARFGETGFPTRRSEQWRHCDLRRLRETAFQRVEAVVEGDRLRDAVARFDFGGLDAHRLVFVNGRYSAEASSIGEPASGTTIRPLAEAIEEGADILRARLTQLAKSDGHPFVALNTAFFEDGAFVHVERGRAPDKPIHMIHLSASPGGDAAAHPRILIVAEESAELQVIESYGSIGAGETYLTNAVTEIFAGRNATVRHSKLQVESDASYHMATLSARLERDATFASHVATFGGALARQESEALLDGEGAHCTLNGLYLANNSQHVEHMTRLDHAKPHCDSFQVFKGIVDDRASGVFNGHILVREGAQKTDAKQSSHNLVLSDAGRADAEPQLEIFADDVKCTHGATIGRLDETPLFYLQSRGIDRSAAKTILTIGFANEVLERMEIEPLRDHCEALVRAHFQAKTEGE